MCELETHNTCKNCKDIEKNHNSVDFQINKGQGKKGDRQYCCSLSRGICSRYQYNCLPMTFPLGLFSMPHIQTTVPILAAAEPRGIIAVTCADCITLTMTSETHKL